MKQKIVLKVEMCCENCRTKAMEISASTYGVTSVAIEESEKETLTVIGNEVDAAELTRRLRKKVGRSTIVSICEEKPENIEAKKIDVDPVHVPFVWAAPYQTYYIVPSPEPSCVIM